MSRVDTAEQAFLLWRAQRGIDADVGALPEAQQARLGQTLLRSSPDERAAIGRMDDATLDGFTAIDVDAGARRSLTQRYAGLDADGRAALREFIDRIEELDAGTRAGLRTAYARGDIDLDTGGANTIAEEIQAYGPFERVTRVERTARGTNVRGVVNGDIGEIEVTGRFYRDGDRHVGECLRQNANEVEAVFRRNDEGDLYEEYGTDAIKHLDEATEGNPANIRGQIGGETLQPELATSKYGRGGFEFDGDSGSFSQGYIPEDDIPYSLDGSKQGFDGFAIDSDGDLVVIETKIKNANGRVTTSKWIGDPLSTGNRQMSNDWIQNKFQALADSADTPEQKEFIRRLSDDDGVDALEITERNGRIAVDDINEQNLNGQLFAYQDGEQTGELASSGLRVAVSSEPTLDGVEIVKIGGVFNGV